MTNQIQCDGVFQGLDPFFGKINIVEKSMKITGKIEFKLFEVINPSLASI